MYKTPHFFPELDPNPNADPDPKSELQILSLDIYEWLLPLLFTEVEVEEEEGWFTCV